MGAVVGLWPHSTLEEFSRVMLAQSIKIVCEMLAVRLRERGNVAVGKIEGAVGEREGGGA